jgi:hypothetical protein
LFSHVTPFQNAKLLISPAYHCRPPVGPADLYNTPDLHGIKTRRIIECGATVYDLIHGALLWLMMAPDNPAAVT